MENTGPDGRGKKKRASVCATIGFVALSLLFVYAALSLFSGFVQKEFRRAESSPVPGEQTPLPDAADAPSEPPADAVIAVVTPEPAASGSAPMPWETPDAAHTTAPDPTQIPAAELETTEPETTEPAAPSERYAAHFDEDRIDVVLALTTGAGRMDCAAVLAIRGDGGALIAIPGNVLRTSGTPLNRAADRDALQGVRSVLPVDYQRYVRVSLDELETCVDAIGPVAMDGKTYDGAGMAAYLSSGGADELLRAERFTNALCALAGQVQRMSLFRMLAVRAALQDSVKTNLSGADGWMLYNRLKSFDTEALERRSLPVDSGLTEAGERIYRIDTPLLFALLSRLYNS